MTKPNPQIPSEIRDYLLAATQSISHVLNEKLLGLYLCGSLVQNDFKTHRSDIDVLGVVSGELDEATRAHLASVLSFETNPVPANGLEVVLFSARAARSPRLDFPFEFALSTGVGLGTESEPPGTANDMLIDIIHCREAGFTLAGPPAREVFGPVHQSMLLRALVEELQWHMQEVNRNFDEMTIVNAVLNAARSLHAAETGQILSKSEGGRWWLQRYPSDKLVAEALAARKGERTISLDAVHTSNFVEKVIDQITDLDS